MDSSFAKDLDFANIGLQNNNIIYYAVTDSTNTRARETFLSSPGGPPRLFIADQQTAGRGTRGRSFESKPGGLYFSLLFSDDMLACDPSLITPLTAAAVYGALRVLLGRRLTKKLFIKWVNDVYMENKKIAGILSESITADGKSGYIIGIGINLYGSDFSPEVADIAASVEAMTQIKLRKEQLLFEIISRLMPMLASPRNSKLAGIYRKHGIKRSTKITVTDALGNSRSARVLGLDKDMHLLVRYPDGSREALISGDVRIKL